MDVVSLPSSVVGRYRRFSLYNSPYPAHDAGHGIDLYPASNVGVSPVAGEVGDTRTVGLCDELERPIAGQKLDDARPTPGTERDGVDVQPVARLDDACYHVPPVVGRQFCVGELLPERLEGLVGERLRLFYRCLVRDAASLLDDVEDGHPAGVVRFEGCRGRPRVVRIGHRDEYVAVDEVSHVGIW